MACRYTSVASPAGSCLSFPRGTKTRSLFDVGWLPAAHGSICCLCDLSTSEFPLSHFPVSEGETLLELCDGPFPNFVSSTGHAVYSHSNDAVVLRWGLRNTSTQGSNTDVS